MKITILLENTVCRDEMKCEHGLSMHIATERHNVLFDMGPNAMFLENAETLGVDVAAVDIAFLSHAHDDHCGGLELFLKRNDRAPVYLQSEVWGDYYVVTPDKTEYAGMDKALHRFDDRFRLVSGHTVIDDELQLFSGGLTRDYWSHANDTLCERTNGVFVLDEFRHEQDLLVTSGGKTALFAGCAHNGIVNILRRAEAILGRAPDAVFAGFHLFNPSLNAPEPRALVDAVAGELKARTNTMYYTGHCTGLQAYEELKETLGDRIAYMSGGSIFEI